MSEYLNIGLDITGLLDNSPTYGKGPALIMCRGIKYMPVRYGEWIYGESEEGHDGYRCSECGEFIPWEYDEYDIDFIKKVHYCPNCGARMDGGNNE